MRSLSEAEEFSSKAVANTAEACTGARRESLMRAEARSRASVRLLTAASSADISAASDQADSRAYIPGKIVRRNRSFLKLSRLATWANSCRRAVSNSRPLSTATADSETRTLEVQTPATVRLGAEEST